MHQAICNVVCAKVDRDVNDESLLIIHLLE